ncbi:MAG TPA: hypothetical protein PLD84_00020 [Chitinophagales bacterium]|nr:hypothetical protein [Chitinophagales bacterium]
MKNLLSHFFLLMLVVFFSSCDFLFGKKEDETVNEIFEQGAIDPDLYPDQVGYVPLLPFWEAIPNPVDVYVGYDEMVYVIDDNGLEIFDQKGTKQRTILIPEATDVIQDRRLHTFVCGKVDKVIDGVTYHLAAVFHIINAAAADQPMIIDTLIQPFCDVSRNNTAFRGAGDEAVTFTGLATTSDNTLYVSRTGPSNSLSSIARPDNTILFFNEEGINTGYSVGLNPVSSSLKSVLNVSSIAGFAAPPQSVSGISTLRDFILLQRDPAAQYKALWIKEVFDPDAGVAYTENASLLNFDTSKANRFLYLPNRFISPEDVFIAPDFSGYIFIVDSGTDSLYQFTQKGFEGVNPPATSVEKKQILASFGGSGSGPFQFIQPSGVCYFEEVVYVADKGNNRICRYKLSTDLE